MNLCFLSVFFVIVIYSVIANEDGIHPIICINDGCVKGIKMPGYKISEYHAFLGIPFAKPPIDRLRFSNPIKNDGWKETLDATTEKNFCIQKNYLIPNPVVMGSEDCLYLNVYRPNGIVKPLPVMAYIHGGGYFSGSAGPSFHGPQYFMDTEEVIIVTIPYRLGVFGFLSTGDGNCPGNFAFKDQVMGLKWIQKNIHNFGGNASQVTIFGQSAGAASVHLHTMSSLSKGLFHAAIIQSGNAVAPYNLVTKNPLEIAREQAKYAGIYFSNSITTAKLVETLRNIDAELLINSGDKFKYWSVDPLTIYRPVVELNAPDAFLTRDPVELHETGELNYVPLLMGFVENEGVVRAGAILENETLLADLNLKYNELIPKLMEINNTSRTVLSLQKITDFYFNGVGNINRQNGQRFVDLYSDRAFLHPLFKTIEKYVSYADTEKYPLHLYRFAFKGPISYSLVFTGTPKDYGVVHCDDLLYLFRTPVIFPNEFSKDSLEANMIEKMIATFVSFAKTGKPIHWNPVRECRKNPNGITFCDYQDIMRSENNTDISINTSNYFNMEMIQLWDEILE